MIKSVFYSLILILTSCTFGGYNSSKDFTLEKHLKHNGHGKSIVIMKIGFADVANNSPSAPKSIKGRFGVNFDDIAQMHWCKEKGDCFYTNKHNSSSGLITLSAFSSGTHETGGVVTNLYAKDEIPHNYIALLIDSGQYNLDEMILNVNPKLSGNSLLARFEVKPDEIVYLGDISVKMCNSGGDKPSYKIEISDTHEQAIGYIKANFPVIAANSIIRRPIELGRGNNANEDVCNMKR